MQISFGSIAWSRHSATLAAALGLLLCAGSRPLAAQEPTFPAAVQQRIRISSPRPGESAIVGDLVGLSGDSLVLRREDDASPLALPLQSVGRIEVSSGHHGRAGTGALIGLLAGAAAGAGFGVAVCGGSACQPRYSGTLGSGHVTAGVAAVTGLAGGLLGAGVGALVGSRFRTERWRQVSLHELRVGAGAYGGMAISARVGPRR